MEASPLVGYSIIVSVLLALSVYALIIDYFREQQMREEMKQLCFRIESLRLALRRMPPPLRVIRGLKIKQDPVSDLQRAKKMSEALMNKFKPRRPSTIKDKE
jgi:hypothetical protein